VIDVSYRESIDPKTHCPKVLLQDSIDFFAQDVREAVFRRECGLGHVYFCGRWHPHRPSARYTREHM